MKPGEEIDALADTLREEEEHRTTPHGWRVVTDEYNSPYAGDWEMRVCFNEHCDAAFPIAVCLADGYETEFRYIGPVTARMYARDLLEAADIAEAWQRGDYIPPASTYKREPLTPRHKQFVEGVSEMLNSDINRLLLFGLGGEDAS